MISGDSIVALSSGRLPAGIAVIRISGPKTRFVVETIAGSMVKDRVAALRKLRAADGSLIDNGLVLFFPGPASFTGEDVAEFHIHGGRAVAGRMLTPQRPLSTIASWNRASRSTQTRTSSGSKDTDASALAVIAWSVVPRRLVTMVTPVARRPTASR
jgi:hypothetical protein